MNRVKTKRVLLIGVAARGELQSIPEWLSSLSETHHFPNVESVPDELDGTSFDLILFLQDRPGVFEQDAVDRLHRRWPLARLIAVLGSWCEGESRSGKPLTGVVRIYWYDFIRRTAPLFNNNKDPFPHFTPRVATEHDRFMADLERPLLRHTGLVLISAATKLSYEILAEACRLLGYDALWQRPEETLATRSMAVVICNMDSSSDTEWERVERIAAQVGTVPVVVALGFPRWSDWERAARCGAQVLAKPFLLPDLCFALSGSRLPRGLVV